MQMKPLVSIVTPSFNQAPYLKATMESVLNQSYSPIEYIVMDGGSSDGSREIIESFAPQLAYWQSEQDRGPTEAINRGWERAQGAIIAYLNSDDLLATNTVETVVSAFEDAPQADVIYGDAEVIDASGKLLWAFPSKSFDVHQIFATWENPVRQPSAFLRRDLFLRFGPLNESLHFCFDFEYWLRIGADAHFVHLPHVLSQIRVHLESITSRMEDIQAKELMFLFERYRDSEIFKSSGVTQQEARNGVYLAAALHYEKAGKRMRAFKNFLQYCFRAFSPPVGLYRLSRYIARLLVRT